MVTRLVAEDNSVCRLYSSFCRLTIVLCVWCIRTRLPLPITRPGLRRTPKSELVSRGADLLSVKPSLGLSILEVDADVSAWLAAGSAMSRAEHEDLAKHVKTSFYGVRVRG